MRDEHRTKTLRVWAKLRYEFYGEAINASSWYVTLPNHQIKRTRWPGTMKVIELQGSLPAPALSDTNHTQSPGPSLTRYNLRCGEHALRMFVSGQFLRKCNGD